MKNKINFLSKMKKNILNKIDDLINKKENNYITTLTDILIESDIEINIVDEIIKDINKKKITDLATLKKELFITLKNILQEIQNNIDIENINKPISIILIGANGVGKTTTTVKLANFFRKNNKKVIIVAGDTYRAAGIEQLDFLCKKNNIQIIKQHTNADSTSVIFDALNVAKNKNIDILIADTSGRLHTNKKLMLDLKKLDFALKKIDKTAPTETLMVIDSNFGQNVIEQVKNFNNFIKISGIILTKFDHMAKGGFIFSIIKNKIPVKYICYGENIEDIKPFYIDDFLKKLLNI